MPKIENRIVDILLNFMRSRSAALEDGARQTALESFKIGSRNVKQREAQFADFEAVAELKTRMGLAPDTVGNWRRLWRDNPALREWSCPPPIGWVLESESQIVGYLGNIPLLYRYGEQHLIAATASGFAVAPSYRAWGPSLMASFYRQENVDLFLNTTAIPAVGKIARALRADPVPQQDYPTVLFWVLDPYSFSKAVMKKLGMNIALLEIGAVGGLVVLLGDGALHRRYPRTSTKNLTIDEVNVRDIDEEFEDFWLSKIEERRRLLASRTPEILRWHFDAPDSKKATRVLRCRSMKRLLGYAILVSEVNLPTGLKTSHVADLLVEGDELSITEHLLRAAYEYAKHDQSHVFEVLGFPKFIRQACLEWRPYSRTFPACPFFYRARDRTLHQKLASEDAWYATPFDGDTTLAP